MPDFPVSPAESPRRVVCHCLNITAAEIAATIQEEAPQSVRDVIRQTGAGSGCTACHCTIRAMLEAAGCRVACGGRSRYVLTAEPAAAVG